MINGRREYRPLLFMLLLSTLFAAVSCTSNESKAKKVIQEYLKPHGVTDVGVDLFYTNPNLPDKAYTSATVVYSFASAEGKPQREFLGFILTRAGNEWRVEGISGYTKEQKEAADYLAGGK